MSRLSTKFLVIAAFATPALVIACSSSSTNSTGTGGTGNATTTHTSGSTTSSTTTSSSSTTTTGDAGTDADCTTQCINNNPTASQKFEGYELKECGCVTGSPCAAMCTAECADPTKLAMTTPCGMCLLAEAAKKTASACTTKAATSDCVPDPMCSAFVTCVLACP